MGENNMNNYLIEKYLCEGKIPKGLISWVADYLTARKYGNVKLAKQTKKNIDTEIKKLNLKKDDVYFYFGNPDDPKQKEKVYKKAMDFK